MNDWVVESPSFEEQLMNNRIVYLNQKGINEVVELIKNKDKEIERLNTNLEVANEDLARIAQLLDLEEGCTIYDIEDKIERLNNIINKIKSIINNSFEYNALTKVALIRESLQGSDKE